MCEKLFGIMPYHCHKISILSSTHTDRQLDLITGLSGKSEAQDMVGDLLLTGEHVHGGSK